MMIEPDTTPEEWEHRIGDQVRRARLLDDIDQAGLAARANVSLSALANLEHGRGSRLLTLIRVCRALGRDDWLGELEPKPDVSPVALARARDRLREPRRASNRTQR